MTKQLTLVGFSVLAACTDPTVMEPAGDDMTMPGDDAPGDMPGDQVTPDQGCGIRTRRAGATAVLHNADGSVKDVATTAADGSATWSACPDDGLISYAFFDGASWRGVTIAGVQPGDDVEVVLDQADLVTTAKLEVPSDNADITFVQASAGGHCRKNTAEGAAISLAVSKDCIGDGATLPILVSGKIDQVYMYAHGSAAMTVGGETVIDNLGTWTTGYYLSLNATGISSNDLMFDVQSVVGDRPYGGMSQLAYANAGSAAFNISVPPVAFANTWRVGVSTNGLARRGIERLTTQFGESFDMSFLLPEITGITVDNTAPARPVFAIGGALGATDVGIIHSSWTTAGVDVEWRMIYPSASTSTITFPVLPTELVAVTPVAATARFAAAFDITGSDYAAILERGYQFGEYINSCAALSPGAECWFTSLMKP